MVGSTPLPGPDAASKTAKVVVSAFILTNLTNPTNPGFFADGPRKDLTINAPHTLGPTPKHFDVAVSIQTHHSPLLSLPTELRMSVYTAAMASSKDGPSLLRTCSQVSTEAQPTLYQRQITMSSQSKLFSFVDNCAKRNLEQVRTLTLHLVDVDLSSLLDQRFVNPEVRQTAYGLYEGELHRLDRAFQELPGIADLTIVPPVPNGSVLLRGLYLSLLRLIPARCPRLSDLTIEDSDWVLLSVPALREVPTVTFARIAVSDDKSDPSHVTQEASQQSIFRARVKTQVKREVI